MNYVKLIYLSIFCGIISILSFFNIVYSYYLNLYLNLDTYYLTFIASLILAVIFYVITILKIGFFLSTPSFLVFSYYCLGERRWKLILIFSFPFVAIFMYLLHGLLAVYLRDPLLKYIGIMG